MLVYSGLSLLQAILLLAVSLAWASGSVEASRNLHGQVVRRLVHAPMWWYDANPSGRTMSRFTGDLQIIEQTMWAELDATLQLGGFALVSIVLSVAFQGGLLALPAVLMVGYLCFVMDATGRSSREVKRMANNAVSPILSALTELRNGAPMIRAMQLEEYFGSRQRALIEEWAGLSFHQKALNSWGLVQASYSALLSLGVALYLIATRDEHSPALVALAITYAYVVPYYISIVAQLYIACVTSLTALERLLEFLHLPQEAARTKPTDPAAGDAIWPAAGRLEFRDVSVRYRPGLPLVLDRISFCLAARERAGIVGRTGAGKSTLMIALFRIVEPMGGSISIDGVNLLDLGLARARQATTIIPQDPVLYKGTVAHNLDPFGDATAERHRDVVTRARLPSSMLDVEVQNGGANISAGERQLICFARALLHPRRLLVLDEATSNLDGASDEAIQTLLRSEFKKTTLLTIAHRLGTVIDYTSIIVMGGGKVLEHGPPAELLDQPDGVLASLARALGPTEFAALRERALDGTQGHEICAAATTAADVDDVEPTVPTDVALRIVNEVR